MLAMLICLSILLLSKGAETSCCKYFDNLMLFELPKYLKNEIIKLAVNQMLPAS